MPLVLLPAVTTSHTPTRGVLVCCLSQEKKGQLSVLQPFSIKSNDKKHMEN